MFREIFFWFTEYLNYFALIFFGIKLFLKKYDVQTGRKEWVENVIIFVTSTPIILANVYNFKNYGYSAMVTYTFVICMCLFIKVYGKIMIKNTILLITIYIYMVRLIDLLITTIIMEISRVSRFLEIDIRIIGIERSIYLISFIIGFYYVYFSVKESIVLDYLKENTLYQWIISIYIFGGLCCFSRVYIFEYEEHLIQYWIFYLLFAFIFFGGFIVFWAKYKINERETLLNLRNDMMEANYRGLKKAYNEYRTLQHDHKNHMLATYELIKKDKKQDALNYINDYVTLSNQFLSRVKSENDILDIIVNSKISEAKEKNIVFYYKVDYLGKIYMEDIDVCALLGNLLDNAIEACEKLEDNNSWIDLKIKRINDMLFIQINNSINPKTTEKRNFFLTEKENTQLHGWGMKSIENVVKKYGGYREYTIQQNKIEILINIPL